MVKEDRLVKSCPSAGGRITSNLEISKYRNIEIRNTERKVSIGKSESLLASIREGREMTQAEKLRLIISLSIPSILAQISATVMFFIDASMVGHLGAKASAAIGLVETTGWLMGGLGSAANMGFSVQVAHAIGANDFKRARRILQPGIGLLSDFQSCHLDNWHSHQWSTSLLAGRL